MDITLSDEQRRVLSRKNFYLRNRERVLAEKKQYYHDNRDARIAYGKQYYAALRDATRAYKLQEAQLKAAQALADRTDVLSRLGPLPPITR